MIPLLDFCRIFGVSCLPVLPKVFMPCCSFVLVLENSLLLIVVADDGVELLTFGGCCCVGPVLCTTGYCQYDVASLYSLSDMVKKSSSFHCKVSKVGRFIGSLCQHSSMISYRRGGHPCGDCILYPCSTWCSTSAFVIPGYGILPYVINSVSIIPNDHTSLLIENLE